MRNAECGRRNSKALAVWFRQSMPAHKVESIDFAPWKGAGRREGNQGHQISRACVLSGAPPGRLGLLVFLSGGSARRLACPRLFSKVPPGPNGAEASENPDDPPRAAL